MPRMNNPSTQRVYVDMMVDTLKRKKEILTFLYSKTKEQEILLKEEELNQEEFNKLVQEKGERIEQLEQMDEGFDRLFKQVEKEITTNREVYRKQIQTMQKIIASVGELGMKIQALEHQNSERFKIYLSTQRKSIRDFHRNNRTASTYYKNMASAQGAGQSHFFNQQK